MLDQPALRLAVRGQDVVYANLTGPMAQQARAIIDAMHTERVMRLIFISSMGIYSEVPGEHYRSVLDQYRDSAALIEQSDLDYTILRPGWFTQDEAIDYQTRTRASRSEGTTCRSTAWLTSLPSWQRPQGCTSVAASA